MSEHAMRPMVPGNLVPEQEIRLVVGDVELTMRSRTVVDVGFGEKAYAVWPEADLETAVMRARALLAFDKDSHTDVS